MLFRVGDRRYPLIAIIEGEAAALDQIGAEINRHGPGGFLGEANLLSGQTVFFTAVVTERMRYVAVEREELRTLLFEDSALSDLLLWTFMARREGASGAPNSPLLVSALPVLVRQEKARTPLPRRGSSPCPPPRRAPRFPGRRRRSRSR